ncbi:MAG: hypothetical protein EOP51_05760 [Sphingobacteriales bacterium]|nr:MAG: hypothetical protein EOP51_05760 [Sphingobacteriales bacterium]
MDRKPFTLEEAIEIAEDFEDLVDSELGGRPPIDYVAVGPAYLELDNDYIDTIKQNSGIDGYQYMHSSNLYDVYAIWLTDEAGNGETMDIRSLTEVTGIQYSFPG